MPGFRREEMKIVGRGSDLRTRKVMEPLATNTLIVDLGKSITMLTFLKECAFVILAIIRLALIQVISGLGLRKKICKT
jgi:hypothetical protein